MSDTELTFPPFPSHPSINCEENLPEITEERIPLLQNEPSGNTSAASGTNTVYTVFLIANAALGAGNFKKIFQDFKLF